MISFNEFKQIEMKVAEVLAVEEHPNADKLFLVKVKIGDEERQIVAGLRGYYTPEQLTGKKIVVVTNLEPAVLRGERSEGMLLAAGDGEKVIFLTPECDIASGSSIS